RATVASAQGTTYWVATERRKAFGALFPSATFHAAVEADVARALEADISPIDARTSMVQGWMTHSGPTDAGEISALLQVPAADIHESLLRLEAGGWALRGQFDDRPATDPAFPDE